MNCVLCGRDTPLRHDGLCGSCAELDDESMERLGEAVDRFFFPSETPDHKEPQGCTCGVTSFPPCDFCLEN